MSPELLVALEPFLSRLCEEQDVFSYDELITICEERHAQMGPKTKPTSKLNIILKHLSAMFEIDLIELSSSSLLDRLAALPKWLMHGSPDSYAQPVLTITGLHKQLGSTLLFEDANAQLLTGSKVALVGKNGAGKSTLFKMILGLEPPDAGEIQLAPHTKIGFLSQEIFREHHERTLLEEMYATLPDVTERMRRLDEIDARIYAQDPESAYLIDEQSEIIERLVQHDGYVLYDLQKTILGAFGFGEHHLSLPLSQLSGGEQTKVQIAKFLLQQVDLLILDEPTNHLDIAGIVFLEQFCQARGKSLLCISHDKRFLNTVFDQVIEISHHQLHRYKGNYDEFIDKKIALYHQHAKEFKNQQKYLEQQEAFINRFRYKDSKAKQVQSRIKLLDKLEKIDAPEDMHTARSLSFRRSDKRLPVVVMRMEWVQVGYDTPMISLPPKLEVTKQMHVGIIGKNGVGKTTLITSLLGGEQLLAGSVRIPPDLVIGSYAQIVESMDGEKTIQNELLSPWISIKEIFSILGSLSLSAEKINQTIGTLSWGEKAKVALTKMLLQKPDLIIMDEPTNHLDILTKESITLLLQQFTGVSLIVSHDRDFLAQVTNIVRLLHDKTLQVFEDREKAFAGV